MRKNYHFFWSFPEVRYAVVKCLYSKSFPDEIKEICTKSLSLSDRFIYNLYLSDALNLVKNYEAAEILQNTILDKKNIEELYEDGNYLSNKNMKYDLEKLLFKGKISQSDYLEFVEGERINE